MMLNVVVQKEKPHIACLFFLFVSALCVPVTVPSWITLLCRQTDDGQGRVGGKALKKHYNDRDNSGGLQELWDNGMCQGEVEQLGEYPCS